MCMDIILCELGYCQEAGYREQNYGLYHGIGQGMAIQSFPHLFLSMFLRTQTESESQQKAVLSSKVKKFNNSTLLLFSFFFFFWKLKLILVTGP
jgi:hypothetical protein